MKRGGGLPPLPPRRHRKEASYISDPGDISRICYPNGQQKDSPARQKKTLPPRTPRDQKHFHWILIGSFLLTINAGFINMLTLSTKMMASAHVTGMVAKLSNLMASGDFFLFVDYLIGYVCFVVGCIVGGVIINYETFYLGRNYGRALFFLAAVEGLALIIENSFPNSITFVYACTFSCGLQNSLTSKYSGNAVRTTHLTGATTDLGIAVGHIIKGRKGEIWKVQMHGIAIVGFFLGGIFGFYAFEKFEHAALLVNISLTVFCAIVHTAYVAYHERIPMIAVLESTQDIRIHRHRRLASDPPSVRPPFFRVACRLPRQRARSSSPSSMPGVLLSSEELSMVKVASDPGITRQKRNGSDLALPSYLEEHKSGTIVLGDRLKKNGPIQGQKLLKDQEPEEGKHDDVEGEEQASSVRRFISPSSSVDGGTGSGSIGSSISDSGHNEKDGEGGDEEAEIGEKEEKEEGSDAIEATPEENPLPYFATGDIAGHEEEEELLIINEGLQKRRQQDD